MDFLAKETKTTISGVLVSSKFTMTIQQLDKDFREQVGYSIPYNKLGYHSLETYLRSLHDTVQVLGAGDYAEVIAVSKMSAHVSELVAKQKCPKGKKNRFVKQNCRPSHQYYLQYNNERYFHASPSYVYPPRFRQFNNYEHQNFNRPHEGGYYRQESGETTYKTRIYENSKNLDVTNNSNSETSYYTIHSDISSSKDEVDKSLTGYQATGQNATTYFNVQKSTSKKSLNESNEGLNESTVKFPTADTISANQGSVIKSTNFETSSRISNDRHSFSALSDDEVFYSDDEELNTRVPQIVQENMRTLVKKYPDGIWCAKIPDLYKKEFGNDLEYTEYGYVSLVQMCLDLGNTFHCIQPDQSDYKLFDKSLHITNDNLRSFKISEYLKIRASVQESTKPALPAGAEELLLHMHPLGVVKLGTYIERQWIEPSEDVESFIDLNVAEVYDPSKFWFHLKRHALQLNKLMDSMQAFYEANAQTYAVPKLGLKIGLYISVIFLNEYHRAVIVDTNILFSKNLLRVFFIDYGSVSLVSSDGVCYLHEQFTTLPAQAIRGRLTGIYPPHRHQQWSRTISSLFLTLVKNKDLVAQIIRIHKEKELLEVLLADTSDEEDFFINDALAFEKDHACFMSEEQLPPIKSKHVPIVHYIHLFPTFDELETGKLPNATEMIHFENAGIGIERIYPHYFKNIEESSQSEVEATGSWKFDYDLAEKNYNQSYEPDEDDSYSPKLNQASTEKIGALIKPVVVEKKHDWMELLSDEEIPVTFERKPKKTILNIDGVKAQAQIKSETMKLKQKQRRTLRTETTQLTPKESPVVLNDQVIVREEMSSVPEIKDPRTVEADKKPSINSTVSDHVVAHDERSSHPKIKDIETIEDKVCHDMNKLQMPKTQLLNPEKPPFVPLPQSNVTYSNLNMPVIKRNIPPPPGFNCFQPVPLRQDQSPNYENSQHNNYVQQVLNINQIHQLQFSLQNVQPKISPREWALICRYFPNVSPQVALFLLQSSYQMQNAPPNPAFFPNPPPNFYGPCYPGYPHPSYYVPQPQACYMGPPRNDVPPPYESNVNVNSPQFHQESFTHQETNDNAEQRERINNVNIEQNERINDVNTGQHVASESELKSRNVSKPEIESDCVLNPEGSKREEIFHLLKNIKNVDLEAVIENKAKKEGHPGSINKDDLKEEIISEIWETINGLKNPQTEASTIRDNPGNKHITQYCTMETKGEDEEDIVQQAKEVQVPDNVKLVDQTNLEGFERTSLHEDEESQNTHSENSIKENRTERGQDTLKGVAKHVLGDLTVHVITHNNNIYFSLEEMAFIFLGNPISVVQIRKMFIGKEHSVSFFDISLKKYPQLKEELIEFGLIKKTALTINLIAASDVAQFVKILTKDDSQLNNFEMFLSDVKKLMPVVTPEC